MLSRHNLNLASNEYAGMVDYESAQLDQRRVIPSAWIMQLVLAISSLPALAIPFLDFDSGTSPVDAIVERRGILIVVGCGFFVPWLLLAWKARLALLSFPTHSELRATGALSWLSIVPALCAIYAMLVIPFQRSANPNDDFNEIMIGLAMGLAALAICAAGMWQTRIIGRRLGPANAIAARLLVAYVTVALCCLMAFFPTPSVGYWLTAAVVAVFITEFISMTCGVEAFSRRSART
jgi:hypothetical protein